MLAFAALGNLLPEPAHRSIRIESEERAVEAAGGPVSVGNCKDQA
jgi:hypothetical protein